MADPSYTHDPALVELVVHDVRSPSGRDNMTEPLNTIGDGLTRYKQALAAENAQWQAEIANLRDLIRRYGDTGMIPVTEISKTLRDGPPVLRHERPSERDDTMSQPLLAEDLRARLADDERLIAAYEAYMTERTQIAGSYVLVRPPGWQVGGPFDTDRMLRQVAAHREIVDEHPRDPVFGWCLTCRVDDSSVRHDWPCPTLRALARGLGIDLEETP